MGRETAHAAFFSLENFPTFTRQPPPDWTGYARRIDNQMLSEVAGPLGKSPLVYICEPTLLVEAVANGLVQIGVEMTACPVECAHCGLEGEMGALLSFGQTPGIVLHCPSCENVIMRIVQTPEAYYLDARGAAYLRLERFPNL